MTNNIIAAKDRARVFHKICIKLGWSRGSLGAIIKKARWFSDGTPAVDANSHTTYPVKTGELAYDYTNNYGYICSVAPTASTAATFVKLHA